jgi:hypothetical protein
MNLSGLVQSLPTGVFVVAEIFLVGMAAVFAVAGLHARRRAALIDATSTSPIGVAEDGYREFEGTIEPAGAELAAPLTGWTCVWYRAKVERYLPKTRDRGHSSWERVSGRTSDEPFVLRDASGACLVRPRDAEVTPTDVSVWYGSTPEPEDRNPPRLAPTESRSGLVEISGGISHRYRYTEERVYAGDPLLALGHFASGRFCGAPVSADALDADEEEEDETQAATGIRAAIAKGSGKPFILSTTSQAAHVAMNQFGGEMALYMAVLPLGAAAIAALMRFN